MKRQELIFTKSVVFFLSKFKKITVEMSNLKKKSLNARINDVILDENLPKPEEHNRNKLYCTFTIQKFQCFLLKLNCWNDV